MEGLRLQSTCWRTLARQRQPRTSCPAHISFISIHGSGNYLLPWVVAIESWSAGCTKPPSSSTHRRNCCPSRLASASAAASLAASRCWSHFTEATCLLLARRLCRSLTARGRVAGFAAQQRVAILEFRQAAQVGSTCRASHQACDPSSTQPAETAQHRIAARSGAPDLLGTR